VRNTSERPFTLIDAMILVAATAVGFGILRDWAAPAIWYPWPRLRSIVDFTHVVLGMMNLYWTIAVVGIRLRRPRPSLRRLGRQPGFVAGVAVLLMTLIYNLLRLYMILGPRRVLWERLYAFVLNLSSVQSIAPAVAVAWMVLAVSGRWRPDSGWIDRLGRCVGFLWLGLLVMIFVKIMLHTAGVL
jgi:hypothetical protein